MLNNTSKSAVKSLNNDNLDINTSIHDVKYLVDRFMTRSFNQGITTLPGVGLLRECYAKAAGVYANQHVIDALSHAQFNKEFLSEEEITFLSEHIYEVFQRIVFGYDIKFTPSLEFVQP